MKAGCRYVLWVAVGMYGIWGATVCAAEVEKEASPPPTVVENAAAAPVTDAAVETGMPEQRTLSKSNRRRNTEQTLSHFSREIAAKVYNEMQEESGNLLSDKVAVVSAVPLSDFKRETEFGRLMAEYLMTDLADQGLQVTELRLGREITILPQSGEFIMTRNVGELANQEPPLDFVLVSTFSNTRNALIVQGRLVSLKTGVVFTSWRFSMPMSRELVGLFREVPEQPFTIAVKGIE